MSGQPPFDGANGDSGRYPLWSPSPEEAWTGASADQGLPPAADLSEPSSAGPPLGFLAVSAVSAAIALALLLTSRSDPRACIAAWFLAGPVTITSIGLFLGADNRRRAADVYYGKTWGKLAYTTLAVVGLVLAAISAWFFADWAGRHW